MKKIVYISAWLFSFIFVIGFLFTIIKQPFGFYLFYIGETLAGLIFFPLLFFYKWKEHELHESRLLFQWIFGQSAVIFFVISTWMRFTDAMISNIFLGTSYSILAFAFLPLLFYNMYKQSLLEI